MLERFDNMISTSWGFICALAIACFEFLLGYKIAISAVFILILLDMFWGIAAALKQKKFLRSELMRNTITKVCAYGSAILVTALLENLIAGSHTIGNEEGAHTRWAVDVIAFIISCSEFISIGGNILIIWPNSVFFRLIRMSLIDEIASKLGMQKEDVKEVFEKNGDFKPDSKTEVKVQ